MNIKYLCKNVQTMYTMSHCFRRAWTFDFIADGDFEFDASEIFQDKAGSTSDSNKVEFFHFSQKMIDKKFDILLLFLFGFFTFFFSWVHFWINLIYWMYKNSLIRVKFRFIKLLLILENRKTIKNLNNYWTIKIKKLEFWFSLILNFSNIRLNCFDWFCRW